MAEVCGDGGAAQVGHWLCTEKNHDCFWYASLLHTRITCTHRKTKKRGKASNSVVTLSQHEGLPCSARSYEPLGFLVPVFPDEVGGVDDDSEAFFIEQEHHFPSERVRRTKS